MAKAVGLVDFEDETMYFVRVIYDSFKLEVSGKTVVTTFSIPHREAKRIVLLAD